MVIESGPGTTTSSEKGSLSLREGLHSAKSVRQLPLHQSNGVDDFPGFIASNRIKVSIHSDFCEISRVGLRQLNRIQTE